MERWHAKLISCLAMFAISLLFVLAPIKIYSFFVGLGKRGEHLLSAMMCFGGGVFLGTYLLHLMPEVRFLLDHALVKPYSINYPIAELITAAGFFSVIFFEKLVMLCYARGQDNTVKEEPIGSGNGVYDSDQTNIKISQPLNVEYSGDESDDPWIIQIPKGNPKDKKNRNNVIITKSEMKESDHTHDHTHVAIRGTRSLLLLVALSLHSVFEGLSIGLMRTTQSVWSMFIAVISHKVAIAFSLGLQSKKSYTELKPVIISAFVFAIMSPAGIGIGTAIMESSSGQKQTELANGIMQGLATGTFIYVTFFEVLQGEITHDTRIVNLIALLGGFTLMALLSLVPEEQITTFTAFGSTMCNSCCSNSTPVSLPNGTFV